MSSERNVDVFAALILVLSIIGIILLATQWFASLYTGANYWHSCLDCENATGGDLIAQILMIVFLIVQIVIAINDLVPNRFIKTDLDKIGLLLAGCTTFLAIIGLATFGIVYAQYEWWPDTGFYGGVIAGLINTILFFLKWRNK
jgi:hypothetical protein